MIDDRPSAVATHVLPERFVLAAKFFLLSMAASAVMLASTVLIWYRILH